MAFLQGNTYMLPVEITNCAGEVLTPDDDIQKVQIIIGGLEKYYSEDGDVQYDDDNRCFVVPLTEEETFAMKGLVKWQVRVLYADGHIDGTEPTTENVYSSITTTRLTEQGQDNQEEGEND